MTTQRQAAAALRASENCAELYIRLGSTELVAAEIASRIGIAERTFYRLFPRKRDTIRPLLDHAGVVMAASIRESVDLPVEQSLARAFRDAFGGAREEQTRKLYPLVFRDRGMWAVLLQAVRDGEQLIRPAIAERLAVPADGIRARAATSIFVSAMLISLEVMAESDADPFATFSTVLTAAADNPLRQSMKGRTP
jgi:TetR/AcrR family transcriptional regulator, regulator of mycofactocin system